MALSVLCARVIKYVGWCVVLCQTVPVCSVLVWRWSLACVGKGPSVTRSYPPPHLIEIHRGGGGGLTAGTQQFIRSKYMPAEGKSHHGCCCGRMQ